MKLNDMTLADIDMAAARNAEQYVKPFKGSAKSAFIEGACWAYEYLTKQGNTPAWCGQNPIPEHPRPIDEPIKH